MSCMVNFDGWFKDILDALCGKDYKIQSLVVYIVRAFLLFLPRCAGSFSIRFRLRSVSLLISSSEDQKNFHEISKTNKQNKSEVEYEVNSTKLPCLLYVSQCKDIPQRKQSLDCLTH